MELSSVEWCRESGGWGQCFFSGQTHTISNWMLQFVLEKSREVGTKPSTRGNSDILGGL